MKRVLSESSSQTSLDRHKLHKSRVSKSRSQTTILTSLDLVRRVFHPTPPFATLLGFHLLLFSHTCLKTVADRYGSGTFFSPGCSISSFLLLCTFWTFQFSWRGSLCHPLSFDNTGHCVYRINNGRSNDGTFAFITASYQRNAVLYHLEVLYVCLRYFLSLLSVQKLLDDSSRLIAGETWDESNGEDSPSPCVWESRQHTVN
jgi:hypothetical protein